MSEAGRSMDNWANLGKMDNWDWGWWSVYGTTLTGSEFMCLMCSMRTSDLNSPSPITVHGINAWSTQPPPQLCHQVMLWTQKGYWAMVNIRFKYNRGATDNQWHDILSQNNMNNNYNFNNFHELMIPPPSQMNKTEQKMCKQETRFQKSLHFLYMWHYIINDLENLFLWVSCC